MSSSTLHSIITIYDNRDHPKEVDLLKSSTCFEVLEFLKYNKKFQLPNNCLLLLTQEAGYSVIPPETVIGRLTKGDSAKFEIYPPQLDVTIEALNGLILKCKHLPNQTVEQIIKEVCSPRFGIQFPYDYSLFILPDQPLSNLKNQASIYDQYPQVSNFYFRRRFWRHTISADSMSLTELTLNFLQAKNIILKRGYQSRGLNLEFLSYILITLDTKYFSRDYDQTKKKLKVENSKKEQSLSLHIPFACATSRSSLKIIKKLIKEDPQHFRTLDTQTLQHQFLEHCFEDKLFACHFFNITEIDGTPHIFTVNEEAMYYLDPKDLSIQKQIKLSRFLKLIPKSTKFQLIYNDSGKNEALQFSFENLKEANFFDEYIASFLMATARIKNALNSTQEAKSRTRERKAITRTSISSSNIFMDINEVSASHKISDGVSILSFTAPHSQPILEMDIPILEPDCPPLSLHTNEALFTNTNLDTGFSRYDLLEQNMTKLSPTEYENVHDASLSFMQQLLHTTMVIPSQITEFDRRISIEENFLSSTSQLLSNTSDSSSIHPSFAVTCAISSLRSKIPTLDLASIEMVMKNNAMSTIESLKLKLLETSKDVSPMLEAVAKSLIPIKGRIGLGEAHILAAAIAEHGFEDFLGKTSSAVISLLQTSISLCKGMAKVGINREKINEMLKKESVIPTSDFILAKNLAPIFSEAIDELSKPENQNLQVKFFELPHTSNITLNDVQKTANELNDFVQFIFSPASMFCLSTSLFLKNPIEIPKNFSEVMDIYEKVKAVAFTLYNLNPSDNEVLTSQITNACDDFLTYIVSAVQNGETFEKAMEATQNGSFSRIQILVESAINIINKYDSFEKMLDKCDPAHSIAISLLNSGENIGSILPMLAIDSASPRVKKMILHESWNSLDTILRTENPSKDLLKQLGKNFKTLSFTAISLAKDFDNIDSAKVQLGQLGSEIVSMITTNPDESVMKEQFAAIRTLLRPLDSLFYDIEQGMKAFVNRTNSYEIIYEIPHSKNETVLNLLVEAVDMMDGFNLD